MSNAMGGIDWNGLPFVVGYLGVQEAEPFIERLLTIKAHRPPEEE